MKVELTLKERHAEKDRCWLVVVRLRWKAHQLVKQKNASSSARSRRSSSSSSAAGFCCVPAGWSLQTPPPPDAETQHGCTLDGNKQWVDKCLKE